MRPAPVNFFRVDTKMGICQPLLTSLDIAEVRNSSLPLVEELFDFSIEDWRSETFSL